MQILLKVIGLTRNVVSYGNKLERYDEPKYTNAFFATFLTDKGNQIVTNFTHHRLNNRKMQIKVGKITDISILKKIKNKDNSAFEELLKYAKSNSGLYDKIVDADKDDFYAIEYNAGEHTSTGNSIIDIKGLENDKYYFLYIKTDDENGKYISNEAVTLAQASVNKGGWGLFFYGSSDFKWADFGTGQTGETTGTKTTTKPKTSSPSKLPYTGTAMIGLVIIIAVGCAVFLKVKNNKYKGI